MNRANGKDTTSGVRGHGGDPVGWMLPSGKSEQGRLNQAVERSQKAGWPDDLLPRVKAQLEKLRTSKAYRDIKGQVAGAGNLRTVTYKDSAQKDSPAREWNVDLTQPLTAAGCGCGFPLLKKLPCPHQLFVCDQVNHPVSTLLHQHDKVETYRLQYQGLSAFSVPDTGSLGDMAQDETLLQPLAFPAPRGAPSRKRRDAAIRKVLDMLKARSTAAQAAAAAEQG